MTNQSHRQQLSPVVDDRTERILQATALIAARLLHAPSWRECIEDVLGELGEATGSDLVYLIQVQFPDEQISVTVRSYWWAPDLQNAIPVEELPLTEWASSVLAPWAERLRSQEPISGHVRAFPQPQRELLEALGLDALHLLPVFANQTWWGMIMLDGGKDPQELTATEFDALRVAADSVGAAITRHRAEQQLQRRNHELDVLNSVIAAATATLEPHTVLHTTCYELARAFNASTAGAALIDDDGRNLTIVAEYIQPGTYGATGEKIPIQDNLATEYVIQSKKPLVIDDVPNDPRMAKARDLLLKRNVASMILLPLIVGEDVVGTFGLDATEICRFGEEEVALAMSAVSAASQVLAKARLLAAEQADAVRMEKILALSTELASIREEQRLLDTLVARAAPIAESPACTVFMIERAPYAQAPIAVLRAQCGLGDEVLGMRIPGEHPLVQRALDVRQPLTIADVDRQEPTLRQLPLREEVHAFFAYPLAAERQPIGFITFSYFTPYQPSPSETNALRLLADRSAAALQNVRLLNAVRSQAAQLAALHEVDVAISTSLEPEEVYETITHSAAQLLDCDLVNLYRWRPDSQQLEGLATFGPSEKNVKGLHFDRELEPMLPYFLEHRRPVAIRDAANDDRVGTYWRKSLDMSAVLLVPMFYHDQLSGILACNDTQHTRNWTAAEIDLAQSLAAQAAIAVANARLHTETRDLLHHSRQQARIVQQIVDTVPDGLLLLDPHHRIVVANPVARNFLEVLAREEDDRLQALAGKPLAQLLGPPANGATVHELIVEGATPRVFELAAHQMEADPLAGGWVLVLHEATQERQQLAYVQAQDRLATVGQLAAGIAHDFNNILAVIVLYAQTLQHADVAPKDRERLSAIYQQAQRASSLIAQILDFSRRSVVERRPLELAPFLEDLGQMLRRTLPETIALHLDIDDPEAIVNVDATRLQQALMNLALNARDAMPRGGALHIALARHDDTWQPALPDMRPGDWVAITVADDGPGIKPDVLPHIFEPFFTTKMPGQGTGLGLAQVYGIVKQHDGFIDVHSRPQEGATFTIYLPALHRAPAPAPARRQASPAANRECILVVEDDPAIQTAVGEVLQMLNYRVLSTSDGAQALEAYEQFGEEIDLVLSDMVMPGIDGAQLHHALHKLNPRVKMVIFTGYPLDEDARAFVEEQGVSWIQKPFTAQALDDAIRKTLDGAKNEAKSRPQTVDS